MRKVYRNKDGKFAKKDGRRKQKEEVIYDKFDDTTVEEESDETFQERMIRKVKAVTEKTKKDRLPRFEKVLEFEKTNNKDLYKWFGEKKVNQIAESVKQKEKNLQGIIRIEFDGQVLERVMKLSDFDKEFVSGHRKGKKYTVKDVIARFAHDMLNNAGYTPYLDEKSDEWQLIREQQKKKKRRVKKKYATNQRYTIAFRNVSKRTTSVQSKIEDFDKGRKNSNSRIPKSSGGKSVQKTSRSRGKGKKTKGKN